MRATTTNWKRVGASVFLIGALFLLLSIQTKAANQSDAIAVRVMPNANHDSIETWYAKQGFKGSPQSLIVDGYEAIRDGRTVFVNAANIDSGNWYIATNESETVVGRECKIRIAVDEKTGAANCSFNLFGSPNTYAQEFTGTIAYDYNTPYCATTACPKMLNVNKCRWAEGLKAWNNQCSIRNRSNKIYTNIYLISYNQESETKTLDILGQLVSHWKFNNNMAETGKCSISNMSCQTDTDCSSGYICDNNDGSTSKGKCVLTSPKVCLIDSDCPVNLFCDSLKARSIRDINRLGKFNQIKEAIESYKSNNGRYPGLQSGTYILGNSLSVWPSWKETLWPQLGLSQLLVDPINSLGFCSGYDPITCWDNKSNAFVSPSLVLPNGSYAFVYKTVNNGLNYSLCSTFEIKSAGYDTSDGKISANSCAVSGANLGNSTNSAPYIVSSNLDGKMGEEFSGYIKIKDDEGDLVSWTLSSDFLNLWYSGGWQYGSNLLPVLQDTADINQKKVYAPRTGRPGTYSLKLTLKDNRGASRVIPLVVKVSMPNAPLIEAENTTYFVDPVNPLKYTFYIQGNNSNPTFTIAPLNTNYPEINSALNNAVTKATITTVGVNRKKVDFSLLIPTSTKIVQDITVPFKISAFESGSGYGVGGSKNVNFNLKIEKPYLEFTCENIARLGKSYPISEIPCYLGKRKSGNHTLTYSATGPEGLSINYGNEDVYLKADEILSTSIDNTVKVEVKNEYGATSSKSFSLKINTFCGDNKKQTPNSEGSGGLYNNGVEECDGIDGVWTRNDVVSQSPTQQYACTSGWNIKSPYPILDNNSCVFKSSTAGGGYCGDGYCQNKIVNVDGQNVTMETCDNCSQDCGICVCTPNCSVNICGSDGCGGSCGECNSGETCVSGSCCATSANVQVCADNKHITYLNGTQVASGSDWTKIEKFPVSVATGKNVFAVNAIDQGLAYGFSATLNLSGCRDKNGINNSLSMTTDSINNWKCTGTFYNNWNSLSYDDNAWPVAKNLGNIGPNTHGNALPYKQIWASDALFSNSKIYCRYTFSTLTNNAGCTPNCTGKCGGDDGCGGKCVNNCVFPETCGGGGVAYTCGEPENFVCTPNCVGKCGGTDGCDSLCPNTCPDGQTCLTSKYSTCKQILQDATASIKTTKDYRAVQ